LWRKLKRIILDFVTMLFAYQVAKAGNSF